MLSTPLMRTRLFGYRSRCLLFAVLWGILGSAATAAQDVKDVDLAAHMRNGGAVLLLRHASAPGTGDPEGFRLDDCATQRNLSDAGREQARSIGAWLRARGIEQARVYSSEWCRCLETAELLGLGPVTRLPALNSFFARQKDREPNLVALEAFLEDQPPNGEPIVLVTHQVTVTALTGIYPASGEAVLMRLSDQDPGKLKTLGRMSFGP
ncbi:histidine phosphatase family protein [Thiocapsa bogorovii]|uniref:histidine phosphatase family protein n=1 Tax=Thiocapsa bogorovii TaxID=521689 RepID=UPI001E2E7A84|nr:histidine phosphatase family protein [Thiocapsa bogorovii]UHD16844.1 histidine phosphatase family protein [Thiocapsa bogorovii]